MNKRGKQVESSIYDAKRVFFEPSIMFFELTNFLATFQTMINKILWDLINTREVASFMDNIIVGTEKDEGYDKVVEEIVKILVKMICM